MQPLVLGAGPAGCAAAITLARGGAVPLLLDRDAQVGDALCGGFLSWRTAARLRALRVDPARLGAHPVSRLALFASGRRAEMTLPATGFGLSRYALDTALRAQAVAAGAELVIDTARGVEPGKVLGRAHTWTGDGLFLATGKHDVRGLPRPRRSADPALGLRLRLPASEARRRLLTGRIELHLFAGGYAGIVLQEDGTANVCLAVRKSQLAGDPAGLFERLIRSNPALAERLADDWPSAATNSIGAVPYGFVARSTEPGLFRLGDQAAVIPSLAGEGMAIAVASGTLAARHWLANGASGAPGYQRAFARDAHMPVTTARLALAVAERPRLAAPGVTLAGKLPLLVHWMMQATRLDGANSVLPTSLAPHPGAS